MEFNQRQELWKPCVGWFNFLSFNGLFLHLVKSSCSRNPKEVPWGSDCLGSGSLSANCAKQGLRSTFCVCSFAWHRTLSPQVLKGCLRTCHQYHSPPVLWLVHWNSWFIGKDTEAGKDWRQEEGKAAEDKMVGCHHRSHGHELGQTLGDGEGQVGLVCCSSWGLRVRYNLATEPQPQGHLSRKSLGHHPQSKGEDGFWVWTSLYTERWLERMGTSSSSTGL